MGCKSKAGKRRSSSPVQRRTGSFRTPVQGGGVGDSIVCVHVPGAWQGAKPLSGEGDCRRRGERATIGTRCPQKLMT